MSDTVQLWLENERPARLVHRGARWRVIDVPTPLSNEPDWVHPLITHPPARAAGWRCTARCEADQQVRVFDLVAEGGAWIAARVYD